MKTIKMLLPTILIILLEIAIGILLIINAEKLTVAVFTLFGIALLVLAVVMLFRYLKERKDDGGNMLTLITGIIAFVIGLVLALGCGIFTAYAGQSNISDELQEKIDIEARFDQWAVENDKAKYMTSITGDEYNSGFEEIYLHTTKEGALEWALVWVPCDLSLEWEIDVQVGKTVIHSADEGLVFRTHYSVYDAAEDTFYDMDGINIEKYPDIESVLCQLKIGRPIGDADNDNELTVLDATRIQRVLAELDRFVDRINDYCCDLGGAVSHFSDYDGDGDTTILDATAIQRKLAGLTTEA